MTISHTRWTEPDRLKFLLRVTDLSLPPDAIRGELALLEPDDWEGMIGAAEEQGVSSLLRHQAYRAGIPIPASPAHSYRVLSGLQYRAQQEAALRLLLEAPRRVPMLLLKGMALESLVYPARGLRSGVDVDLLFPPASQERICRIFSGLGASVVDVQRFWGNICWKLPGGALLEGHFGSLWTGPFSRLLARSAEIDVFGLPLRTLGPEDQVLFLSAHLSFNHRYAPRLIWIHDLKMLLWKTGIDWGVVVRRARELGILRLVRRSLMLLSQTYGFPEGRFPPPFLVSRSLPGGGDLLLHPERHGRRLWTERTYLGSLDHVFVTLALYARRGASFLTGGR